MHHRYTPLVPLELEIGDAYKARPSRQALTMFAVFYEHSRPYPHDLRLL